MESQSRTVSLVLHDVHREAEAGSSLPRRSLCFSESSTVATQAVDTFGKLWTQRAVSLAKTNRNGKTENLGYLFRVIKRSKCTSFYKRLLCYTSFCSEEGQRETNKGERQSKVMMKSPGFYSNAPQSKYILNKFAKCCWLFFWNQRVFVIFF